MTEVATLELQDAYIGVRFVNKNEDWEHYGMKEDKFELMQFTGLTDKNGKEIFIGDILCTWNKGGEGLDDWYVPDNGYTVVEEDPEELGIRYSKWAVEVGNRDSIYDIQFVEVLGNIYENPELLAP